MKQLDYMLRCLVVVSLRARQAWKRLHLQKIVDFFENLDVEEANGNEFVWCPLYKKFVYGEMGLRASLLERLLPSEGHSSMSEDILVLCPRCLTSVEMSLEESRNPLNGTPSSDASLEGY